MSKTFLGANPLSSASSIYATVFHNISAQDFNPENVFSSSPQSEILPNQIIVSQATSAMPAAVNNTMPTSTEVVAYHQPATNGSVASGSNNTANSKNGQVFQIACLNCRNSHRKCSKILPTCTECLDRKLNCIYSKPKNKRGLTKMLEQNSEKEETSPLPAIQHQSSTQLVAFPTNSNSAVEMYGPLAKRIRTDNQQFIFSSTEIPPNLNPSLPSSPLLSPSQVLSNNTIVLSPNASPPMLRVPSPTIGYTIDDMLFQQENINSFASFQIPSQVNLGQPSQQDWIAQLLREKEQNEQQQHQQQQRYQCPSPRSFDLHLTSKIQRVNVFIDLYFTYVCMGMKPLLTPLRMQQLLENLDELEDFPSAGLLAFNPTSSSLVEAGELATLFSIQAKVLQLLGKTNEARDKFTKASKIVGNKFFCNFFEDTMKGRDLTMAGALLTMASYLLDEGNTNKSKFLLHNIKFILNMDSVAASGNSSINNSSVSSNGSGGNTALDAAELRAIEENFSVISLLTQFFEETSYNSKSRILKTLILRHFTIGNGFKRGDFENDIHANMRKQNSKTYTSIESLIETVINIHSSLRSHFFNYINQESFRKKVGEKQYHTLEVIGFIINEGLKLRKFKELRETSLANSDANQFQILDHHCTECANSISLKSCSPYFSMCSQVIVEIMIDVADVHVDKYKALKASVLCPTLPEQQRLKAMLDMKIVLQWLLLDFKALKTLELRFSSICKLKGILKDGTHIFDQIQIALAEQSVNISPETMRAACLDLNQTEDTNAFDPSLFIFGDNNN